MSPQCCMPSFKIICHVTWAAYINYCPPPQAVSEMIFYNNGHKPHVWGRHTCYKGNIHFRELFFQKCIEYIGKLINHFRRFLNFVKVVHVCFWRKLGLISGVSLMISEISYVWTGADNPMGSIIFKTNILHQFGHLLQVFPIKWLCNRFPHAPAINFDLALK